ncbi:hypothetical protein A2U01_0113980, partial [Trifolium medium]|nr:hypothetical protein [Trifolium medium]
MERAARWLMTIDLRQGGELLSMPRNLGHGSRKILGCTLLSAHGAIDWARGAIP